MLTNTRTEDEVISSITLDPRIPDPLEIAVSGDGGIVTLRGTVESFAQRRAAVKDARAIEGVYEVHDELKVNLLGEYRRDDEEIRGIALQLLIWDVEVPAESVDVKVNEGWVTLKGGVDYQFQSDAAYDDVASLYGVLGITNEINGLHALMTVRRVGGIPAHAFPAWRLSASRTIRSTRGGRRTISSGCRSSPDSLLVPARPHIGSLDQPIR